MRNARAVRFDQDRALFAKLVKAAPLRASRISGNAARIDRLRFVAVVMAERAIIDSLVFQKSKRNLGAPCFSFTPFSVQNENVDSAFL